MNITAVKKLFKLTDDSVKLLLYCMFSTTKCFINFSTKVSHPFFSIDS